MVFRAKNAKTWKIRVEHPDGRHAVLTTRCTLESDARDMARVVHLWQGRKGKAYERLDVLDALVEKRITLPDAVDAHHAGVLDRFLAAHQPAAPVVDLMPALDRFIAEKRRAKKGAGQADTYRKQLLALYPEGITLATFTRKEIWSRLEALDVDSATRNRYRSGVSMFAKSLVKQEILETNFVRDIGGDMFGENDPRLVYYELDDAKKLLAGLAQPYAAIAALALGFCAEWGAITRAIVSDVALEADPVTAHVRGTKRSWRDRFVPLVPELAWTLDYLRPALKGKTPGARIIEEVPEWRAIDVQRATARDLKLAAIGEDEFGEHSLHDWRHTHAVALTRAGYLEQIVSDHLGHKDTALVRKVYGRFKPTKHDYAKAAGTSVTPIRKPKKSPKGKRAASPIPSPLDSKNA